jgi:hypothetical protein
MQDLFLNDCEQNNPNRYVMHKSYDNGGIVWVHLDVDKSKSDYDDLLVIACWFAENQGKTVKITPVVHFKSEAYKEIYGTLVGTKYANKCPDMQIGAHFYEYESFVPPFRIEKIGRMISKGVKQSSRIIINITNSDVPDHYIISKIEQRLLDKTFNRAIDEVWIVDETEVRLLFKSTEGSKLPL